VPSSEGALDRLLRPRSVAIVGLSRDPAKHGARVLANLRRFGFDGAVWGVNPRWSSADGGDADGVVARIGDLPAAPDLVVLAVPARSVPDAVEEAGRVGAGAAVVLGGGFAEAGPAGALLQQRAREAASRGGLRLLGPNSAGIVDVGAGVVLSFLTCLDRPTGEVRSGPVALLSQSGGTASLVHNAAYARGGGLAVTVATGNEADLGVGELLDAVVAREDVTAVALLLETVRDGDAFVAAARRAVEARKPLVVCKVGRSAAGADVMSTHTGALAAPWRRFEAAFDSLGITVTETPEELLEVAELLARSSTPEHGSVGVVTHSGGTAVLLADQLTAVGACLPPISEGLRTSLAPYLQTGAAKNPADLGGILTEPTRFADAVGLFTQEPDLGIVVSASTPHPPAHSLARAESLLALSRSAGKPLLHLWTAGDLGAAGLDLLRREGAAVSTDVRAVARAAGGLARLSQLGATGPATVPALGPVPPLADRLDEAEAKRFLAGLGLPTLPFAVAADVEEARRRAAGLGYPVVVKVLSRDVEHKSEWGLVEVGLGDDQDVAAACRRLAERADSQPELRPRGYLVEAYRPGLEVILGVVQDPAFGPMVLVGTGGVQAELFEDVALGLAPLTEPEALRLVRSLRGRALLQGFRGGAVADEDALAAILTKLAGLAVALRGLVAEIDLNPVIYADGGWWIADAVVRPAGTGPR
jgi:acyl-CoA synthetase (NDP forming)